MMIMIAEYDITVAVYRVVNGWIVEMNARSSLQIPMFHLHTKLNSG